MEKDNRIDITEYINPENELSEEMVQAYLDAAEREAPDLWNSIEAGFDMELETLNHERKLKKARRRKYAGIAAAVIMITAIAVPVILLNDSRKGNYKSGNIEGTDGSMIYEDMYIMEETQDGSNYDNDIAFEEGAGDDVCADAADTQAEAIHENDDISEDVLASYIIVTAGISVQDEAYIVHVKSIKEIAYEDYGIKAGDKIAVTNPQELEGMLTDAGIDIDAVGETECLIRLDYLTELVTGYAEYEGRVIELEKN